MRKMTRSCDYCRYLDDDNPKFCKFIDTTTPAERLCKMYKCNTKKILEEIGPEEECKDGSCKIKEKDNGKV